MPSSRRKSVQQGAHAFTILSMFWTLFSLFALFDWYDQRHTANHPNAIPDLVIWSLHILFICLAILLFRKEKKREGLWLGDENDDILFPTPQEANLPYVRSQLGKELKRRLKTLPLTFVPFIILGLFVNINRPIMRFNDIMIFLGVVLLLILCQIVGGTFYKYFTIVSRHKEFEKQQKEGTFS